MSIKPKHRGTRVVNIGNVKIGGGNPVAVQSMTNTDTKNVRSTLAQIRKLEKVGCELIRVAVPDKESAGALNKIIKGSPLPVVADVHFESKLAILAIDAGIHGLRLNPGNIRSKRALKEVINAAAQNNVPIRVGVNAGSIARDVRKKHGGAVPKALVESAMEHINILEDMDFKDIKISLKASDVLTTVQSYRLMRKKRDYPLHLGVTEAGTAFSGLIKSSVGLGILLAEGIVDTIRVSLAADPVEEIRAAYGILASLGLRQRGLNIVACPTCARRGMDVVKIADQVERKLQDMETPLSIAVMGCQVNGPGEARHADLGVVGLKSGIQIYVKGKRAKKVLPKDVVNEVVAIARKMAAKNNG